MKTNTILKIVMLCIMCAAATMMSGCMESDGKPSGVSSPDAVDPPEPTATIMRDVADTGSDVLISPPVTIIFSNENDRTNLDFERLILNADGTTELCARNGTIHHGTHEYSSWQSTGTSVYDIKVFCDCRVSLITGEGTADGENFGKIEFLGRNNPYRMHIGPWEEGVIRR